jgi:hypothetical protein
MDSAGEEAGVEALLHLCGEVRVGAVLLHLGGEA